MEQTVLCSIALFLLVQGGCLIWILSDLTTRTKLMAMGMKEITEKLSGFENKYITEREVGIELGGVKNIVDALIKRIDNVDHNNCENYKKK